MGDGLPAVDSRRYAAAPLTVARILVLLSCVSLLLAGCGEEGGSGPSSLAAGAHAPKTALLTEFVQVAYAFDGLHEQEAAVARIRSNDNADVFARVSIYDVDTDGREVLVAHGHTIRSLAVPGRTSTLFLEVAVPVEGLRGKVLSARFETKDGGARPHASRRLRLELP